MSLPHLQLAASFSDAPSRLSSKQPRLQVSASSSRRHKQELIFSSFSCSRLYPPFLFLPSPHTLPPPIDITASGGATPTATAISTVSSDFFSSLASAYSVTPASISSLVMPPTAIPSASSALTYIDDNWSHIKGSSDFVTFVEDPLKSTGEVVLAVDYPEGSYPGGTDGGVGNMQMGVFSSGMQRAMVSYEVGFSEKFDFVEGASILPSFLSVS